MQPLLQQVSSVLAEGSQAVIDSDDQYEACSFGSLGNLDLYSSTSCCAVQVFNNPNASDPSHSLLSKVHFL